MVLLLPQRYVNNILQPIVLPYAAALGEQFMFIDDNTRLHGENIVVNWFEKMGIDRLNWLTKSLDDYTNKHAWNALRKQYNSGILNCSQSGMGYNSKGIIL